MPISEKIEKAMRELESSAYIDGHNTRGRPDLGPSGRTINACAALIAAIEAECEAAADLAVVAHVPAARELLEAGHEIADLRAQLKEADAHIRNLENGYDR